MTPGSRPSQRATELADAVHSAAIHVLRFLRTEDVALGVSAPKLSALSVLVFRGPLTMGELAAAEQVTPATISRLVTELEVQGLVVRASDQADARVRVVTPTADGTALLREGRRRRVARLAAAVEELGAKDRRVLERAARLLEEMVSRRPARTKTPRREAGARGARRPA
jgi:DNA-binding MarR family transcriptional regulator